MLLETPVPLGCGFGISAASALSTAFALARRFSLEKSRLELGEIVLRAEIEHRTGIGDPITQLLGGVVLRRWRSGPFDAQSLPLPADSKLYYRVFGPLSTKEVLSDPALVHRLAQQGRDCVAWLEQNQQTATLTQLFERSLGFALKSGLVSDARVIHAIDDVQWIQGRAMMVMLGQSVLADRTPLDATGWQETGIDQQGTRYIC